jgi:hypothetical protein
VAQDHLPSKCEALSSNLTATKKKKKERKKRNSLEAQIIWNTKLGSMKTKDTVLKQLHQRFVPVIKTNPNHLPAMYTGKPGICE